MDQHQQAFIIEAKELLPQLENGLLALEEDPKNNETINSVFRALHTIKGSGGMFGFDAIECFTHDLENAFEQVRNGAQPVTADLIDLTLAARDEIQYLVEIAESGSSDEKQAQRALILQKLKILTAIDGPGQAVAETVSEEDAEDAHLSIAEVFHIHFRPEANSFKFGSDPLLLLDEIGGLGTVEMTPLLDKIPALDLLDPEVCYFGWDIVLETHAGENAIRDVFIFVADDCELEIEKVSSANAPSSANAGSTVGSAPVAVSGAADVRASNKPDAGEKSVDRMAAQSSSSVRVPSERLDKMVNLVGELVIAQARLSQLGVRSHDPEIIAVAEEIERLTGDMRDTTMSMRMVPIGSVFGKYKRIVRDLSRELGKRVELETTGGETELDKTVIERLHDPMVHLIRNAVDHGIESPEIRQDSAKSPLGRIKLSAVHSGAYVLISVTDDGAGLSRERILKKAVARGLVQAEQELSDSEVFELILEPGFSTRDEVSSLSGRGVGMDVVARGIYQLGGRVQIDSEEGKGTTITLRLPLTLAIIDGLQIRCAGADYILPLGVIEECVELSESEVLTDRYRRFVNLRDETVPYINLRSLFAAHDERPADEKIVIINDAENRFGIVVDMVVGQLQAVIKPLGKLCRDIPEYSGATILGDGTVALILDIGRIFDIVCAIEEMQKEAV